MAIVIRYMCCLVFISRSSDLIQYGGIVTKANSEAWRLQAPLSYDNSFTGCRFANELPTRYHWSHTRREPSAPQLTCPISSTTTYRQEHYDLPINCYWLYLECLLRCRQNLSVSARLQCRTHCHIVVNQPKLCNHFQTCFKNGTFCHSIQ